MAGTRMADPAIPSDAPSFSEAGHGKGPHSLPGSAQRANETSPQRPPRRPARRWRDRCAGREREGVGFGLRRRRRRRHGQPDLCTTARSRFLLPNDVPGSELTFETRKACPGLGSAGHVEWLGRAEKAPKTSASFGGPSCPTSPGRRASERPPTRTPDTGRRNHGPFPLGSFQGLE